MPSKVFTLESGLEVTVYKRKSSRSLRLSVDAAGKTRVSIPVWAPYRAGVVFAASREEWITAQVVEPQLLKSGQAVGKAHHLLFLATASGSRVSSRVLKDSLIVRYPREMDASDPAVQKVAREACIRALRTQAEQLLPQRIATLAEKHGFEYASVTIKRLKGRWGSCDQHKNIIFNLYLMQLPWELIDYVILHELTHTQILRHGPDFWNVLERVLPHAKQLRKQIGTHQPILVLEG